MVLYNDKIDWREGSGGLCSAAAEGCGDGSTT